MPRARELVFQASDKPHSEAKATYPLRPAFAVKPGEKVLFVAKSESDPMIIEAMSRAFRERGARIDVVLMDLTPLAPPEEWPAHEAISLGKEEDDNEYSYIYTKSYYYIRWPTVRAMVESEKYDSVIAGFAGPLPLDYVAGVPWRFFRYHALENWVSPAMNVPSDVLQLISEKTHAKVLACEEERLTDPEGTDVKWTNYGLDKRAFMANHIWARPPHIGYGFGGKDDCTGIVAGTWNHVGVYPHVKAYIEGGQVVKVEGGGKYGEAWREKLEEYRNVKLPPLSLDMGMSPEYEISEPGLFWFHECAIGTVPGLVPAQKELLGETYNNISQTLVRAGHIHCGFGASILSQEQVSKAGLPFPHVHIHLWFSTLEGRTKNGETVTIIDKGHLTALDDPEVRSLASRYGDPDELLKLAWIPAIPGINLPGDYMKDYGQDPLSWWRRQVVEHPIWID
jgi:hypothetical protein